jgi:hypothetical protein
VRTVFPLWLPVLWTLAASPAQSQESPWYTAAQAAEHIYEQATVCGEVAGARLRNPAHGSVRDVLLYLDHPNPENAFVVLIPGWVRGKFVANPKLAYLHEWVCVSGKIWRYRGSCSEVESRVCSGAGITVAQPSRITRG